MNCLSSYPFRAALAAAVMFSIVEVSARTWTNTDGKTVEADLVSADAENAALRLANGKLVTISIKTLSLPDEVYISEWLKKRKGKVPPMPGKEDAPAPPPAAPEKDSPPSPPTPAPTTAGEGPVGFDGMWPDKAEVPEELNIEIVREDDYEKVYIYRSTHFEFTCNVQLRKRLVSTCAKVFEATHEFLRVMPLNHTATAGTKGKLFPVLLFETYDQYVKAGGPPGSAGVCMYRGDESKVLVPLRSFGVKKAGSDYTVDPQEKDYKVLSHEITHQLMTHQVKEASWYIEGSAEYVAYTPYTGSRYRIRGNESGIREGITAYGKDNQGGRALGRKINMPRLSRFMTLSYQEFLSNSNFNYGAGCLLTYYFYHLDGNKDAARMKAYIRELQADVPEEKAREKLMEGRTWEQLEKDFEKGMRSMGIDIEFGK